VHGTYCTSDGHWRDSVSVIDETIDRHKLGYMIAANWLMLKSTGQAAVAGSRDST
jgi:hypothetical protein